MANLIGNKPNQVPTNGDLGTMAFQDSKSVKVEGGSIDKVSIGASVAASGAFTTLTATGNVGIGTSSPGYALDVIGNIRLANAQYLRCRTSGALSPRMLGVNASDVAYIGPIDPGPVASLFSVASTNVLTSFYTSGTEHMRIAADGKVLIGTTTAGASKLTVADDSIQVNTAKTPASATATGTTGQIAWDANYVYVCVATDTWKRSALSTW
jgi:hypothetical protein